MKKVFQNKGFHIGKMLLGYYKTQKNRRSELAERMNRSYQSMLEYENRSTLQTSVLWEYCHALECNFFQVLADRIPETYAVPHNLEGIPPSLRKDKVAEANLLEEENKALKQQLALLEHENKVLKELIRR